MVVAMIKRKLRVVYGLKFILILIIEILIALFVRDSFIRPYVGDMLVTVLICCFVRIFIPVKLKFAPLLVFAFSVLVEIGQYFDFVKLLGLDNNLFLSTLLGRTFSVADIICYGIGCVLFTVFDYIIKRKYRGAL
jgi:hypothetical protein